MSRSGLNCCPEWGAFLNQEQMRGPEAKPFLLFVRCKQTSFQAVGAKASCSVKEGTAAFSLVRPKAFTSFPTFPWATSSLWAAEADLTRALVAAAMDLAASKICSSKSSVSSACYNQKKRASHAIRVHKGCFVPNYLLLGHLALHPSTAFC